MKEAIASIKQIKGLVKERNKLHAACMDVLAYFDEKENDSQPQWDVDYVRNTLQNAIEEINEEI